MIGLNSPEARIGFRVFYCWLYLVTPTRDTFNTYSIVSGYPEKSALQSGRSVMCDMSHGGLIAV